jgi:hypothetical protein
VYSALGPLMAQVYERNEETVRELLMGVREGLPDGHTDFRKDETPHHLSKFIQHTPGWRRAAIRLPGDTPVGHTGATCIDNLAGYYWGARPCGVEQFNHQYLACPSLKIDPQTDPPMLNRLQSISDPGGHETRRARYAMTHLTALHRNSLYVRSVCQTLAKLVGILKPYNGAAIRFHTSSVLRPHPHNDLLAAVDLHRGLEVGEIPADAPGPQPDAVAHTLADFQRRLKAETDALDAGIKQARSASSYPGISWPVVYGVGEGDHNLGAFERVHAIPRPTPPLVESADRARAALERMAFIGMEPVEIMAAVGQAINAAEAARAEAALAAAAHAGRQ